MSSAIVKIDDRDLEAIAFKNHLKKTTLHISKNTCTHKGMTERYSYVTGHALDIMRLIGILAEMKLDKVTSFTQSSDDKSFYGF